MVLSQLLFLGENKIPRQNLSPKKNIKTQLLINIIIYSMNPIPFIHPISKTQKTSNFSKVHLRGRFTQTTLKAAETSAPLVKEPAPRLGQGYAVMSVLTVIAWIITSILALARHPAVTWCLSGVTFFFLTEKYPCDFFKKSQANFQEEVVGKDVSFIPAIGKFFGLGLYGMKACFSRRKSCCDPMKGCWKWCIGNHWLLRSVCRGGLLSMIHLKVQRTFTRELLDADYLQENSELYWGKMLVFGSVTLFRHQRF